MVAASIRRGSVLSEENLGLWIDLEIFSALLECRIPSVILPPRRWIPEELLESLARNG
jgi:hypothetical protein